MNRYSMEVFAEAHRIDLLEEAERRRFLKVARQATGNEPVRGGPRPGPIGRGLARLARLGRPDRPAAAS